MNHLIQTALQNISEGVLDLLTEDAADKLACDVKSLKRIGWSLDQFKKIAAKSGSLKEDTEMLDEASNQFSRSKPVKKPAAGTVIDLNLLTKLFPSGSKTDFGGGLMWHVSGGYAGERSLKKLKEKLEAHGFKWFDAKLNGVPDGSYVGNETYLQHKKSGWVVSLGFSYGSSSSGNSYSARARAPKGV